MWNNKHGVVVSKWTLLFNMVEMIITKSCFFSMEGGVIPSWCQSLELPKYNLSLCGKVKLPCSVHHVLCVALLKSFFNWCTELASGSPLHIPVFSEHYTWIIPLDVPEARFWALFPDDEEGKQIFLISNKLIELLFKTFSQKC